MSNIVKELMDGWDHIYDKDRYVTEISALVDAIYLADKTNFDYREAFIEARKVVLPV